MLNWQEKLQNRYECSKNGKDYKGPLVICKLVLSLCHLKSAKTQFSLQVDFLFLGLFQQLVGKILQKNCVKIIFSSFQRENTH